MSSQYTPSLWRVPSPTRLPSPSVFPYPALKPLLLRLMTLYKSVNVKSNDQYSFFNLVSLCSIGQWVWVTPPRVKLLFFPISSTLAYFLHSSYSFLVKYVVFSYLQSPSWPRTPCLGLLSICSLFLGVLSSSSSQPSKLSKSLGSLSFISNQDFFKL